jgi:hypothetical protein
MSCPCIQSNPIPTCIDTLTIGIIGKINTPVLVQITSIATGRVDLFEVVSDSDGLVIIDVADYVINDQANYKVEIFTVSNPYGPAETITVNDVSDVCVYFTGKKSNGFDYTEARLSTESNETPPSPLRPIYHFTDVDYSVPEYIQTVGVDATAGIIHITLGNPNIYKKGLEMSVSDEAKTASINTIVVHGAFALGDPQVIAADGGSITFYSNGYDKFIITASN